MSLKLSYFSLLHKWHSQNAFFQFLDKKKKHTKLSCCNGSKLQSMTASLSFWFWLTCASDEQRHSVSSSPYKSFFIFSFFKIVVTASHHFVFSLYEMSQIHRRSSMASERNISILCLVKNMLCDKNLLRVILIPNYPPRSSAHHVHCISVNLIS